jgi:hypothetical protein
MVLVSRANSPSSSDHHFIVSSVFMSTSLREVPNHPDGRFSEEGRLEVEAFHKMFFISILNIRRLFQSLHFGILYISGNTIDLLWSAQPDLSSFILNFNTHNRSPNLSEYPRCSKRALD